MKNFFPSKKLNSVVVAILALLSPSLSVVAAPAGSGTSEIDSAKLGEDLNTTSQYSRICGLEDMEGFWKVVKWTAFYELKPQDWKNSIYMKHQWVLIGSRGEFRTIGSNMKMDADKAERKIHELPVIMLLSFDGDDGLATIISKNKKPDGTKWRCSIVTRDVSSGKLGIELKKGDVIMVLLAPSGNIIYFRQLRRADN